MRALITGVTGQDGSYLAELCIAEGFEVHGLVRRSSTVSRPRIDHLYSADSSLDKQPLKLHYGDLSDMGALVNLIDKIQPEVIFNLAAQSHVAVSFELPFETSVVTGLGALNVFEAARIVNRDIKIYQAGSSEMFGGMLGRQVLNEESRFLPKSPYAAAKVQAHHLAQIYRDSYGMKISNGILFNHESPRRGENFVSRKIAKAAARIYKRKQEKLTLGNIRATRDWGHAQDYVEAIFRMTLAEGADDFVVATGKSYSVEDFAEQAFSLLGLDYRSYIDVDPRLFRPNEVENLRGDPSKIQNTLGWEAQISFEQLVKEMVESELKLND